MLTRLVLRLYPKRFRERYGEEIADLLEDSPHPLRDLGNVLWSALAASRWWLLAGFWAVAIAAWVRFPELYAMTLPIALMVTAIFVGLVAGRRGCSPAWQHPLAALTCFGLAWLLPPDHIGLRLLAYLVWLAGGALLIFGMRRLRGWVWLGAAALQLGTLAILYGGQTVTAFWMLSANYAGEAPLRPFVPMVLLNPALAFALTYAYAAKTRTAPAPVGTLEG